MLHHVTRQSPTIGEKRTEHRSPSDAKRLSSNRPSWTVLEKTAFRFAFIYFCIQSVPLDPKYYLQLLSVDLTDLYYGDIFLLARYYPRFFPGNDTFLNWAIAAAIALIGSLTWGALDQKRTQYDRLYYWLRVIVRYRLAIAVIAYGFIKVFPIQAPYPSISNLNTHYGDFTHWKVFTVSLGAAPLYERFLGSVEIFAGLLLFWRCTATIGAFVVIAFEGNVFVSNLAYEGGEHIYSLYLLLLAVFLIVFDARRIWNLISEHKPTSPNTYHVSFANRWEKRARGLAKTFLIAFFAVAYGALTYAGYKNNPHTLPVSEGLSNAKGVYAVKEFRLNGKTLPYSPVHPFRWQDVVFEKWATISVRSNRPVIIDSLTSEIISRKDDQKSYEHAGIAGRHFYSYTVDTVKKVLLLKNKNSHYPHEYMQLNYERPDVNTMVLRGLNENEELIYVKLERINKTYLFPLGRSTPINL